ncbi:LamG domain-containing protein [Niastella caeni]|uniref:LamG domain-containing protein n=1 Tax=Niastella caeni TaxID=2569763 RepID=A0A4S8HBI0_9BACT|nr:LamG domain-containing protein [Niastella caeni]THU30764.1 LamG domain-containing protein [Niastella caeni]
MKIQHALAWVAAISCSASCRRDLALESSVTDEKQSIANARLSAYAINGAVSPYDNMVLADDPVAFWNKGSATDITGHGHTGILMNAPSTSAMPNGDRALLLNGINQYAEIDHAAALTVSATGILTLEAWVRPDVLEFPDMEGTGYVNWMGKGEAGQHEYVCRMYGQNPTGNDAGRTNRIIGNAFTLTGQTAAGSYYQPASDWALTPGEWIHYIFIINKNAVTAQQPYGYTKLYVQRRNSSGEFITFQDQDALNGSALLAGTAPFRIGTRNMDSHFKGAIGKVALYNYEPDSARLMEHGKKMYDYDHLILSRNPVAYWNTAGRDITGHGHLGTLLFSPGVTTMPNGDASWVFDGISQRVEVADAPDLSIPATGILTMEAWLRPDVLDFDSTEGTGYVHWAGKRENGQCEYVGRMYGQHPTGEDADRLNRISGYAFNLPGSKGAGSYYQAAANWPVQTGEWIHYTLIINTVDVSAAYPTGYTKLYVHRKNSNGTIITFQDKDALIGYNIIPEAGTAPFRIGTADTGSFFQGSIGKVALYNYELSAAQLLQHAERIFNP